MAKQPRVWTGTQWDTLAVTLPDLSNYSTTTQMNTAIDNAKGLVLINATTISSASSVSINNCFSTTYDNYKIAFNTTAASTNINLFLQLRASGSDLTSALYNYGFVAINQSGLNYNASAGSLTSALAVQVQTLNSSISNFSNFIYDCINPYFNNRRTVFMGQNSNIDGNGVWVRNGGFWYDADTRADGFTLTTGGGATFSGTLRIYGYRNS